MKFGSAFLYSLSFSPAFVLGSNLAHSELSIVHHASVACPPIPLSKEVLYNCALKDDILQIKNVTLEPNPPKRGEKLKIKAHAFATKDIEAGANLRVAVKLGIIKLIELNLDLCEKVHELGIECPVKKGPITLSASFDLPNEIPMGTFFVDAIATSKDQDRLAHILAKLRFPLY